MYERFTDRARKVMQLANQEAQRFNHDYIGTEHILLGLIKEGSGVGANVLKNLDIDLRKIRLEVEKIVQAGPENAHGGKLPQTPRAKKVIEYAVEEARALHHNYVGTEHLLLGLMREEEGVAAQVVINLGLSLLMVREEVYNLLGHNLDDLSERVSKALRKFGAITGFINPVIKELVIQLEQLREAKEEAIAKQDFERAAQLRDEEDRFKKQLQELRRQGKETSFQVVLDCELYLPLRLNENDLIAEEKLSSIRDQLRSQFGFVVETRLHIDGKWQVGPATLHGEVVVLRVLSSEPVATRTYLRQMKEQLKADLGHENIVVLARKAQVL